MTLLGFAVYQIPAEDTERAVCEALAVGYRLLNTARSPCGGFWPHLGWTPTERFDGPGKDLGPDEENDDDEPAELAVQGDHVQP